MKNTGNQWQKANSELLKDLRELDAYNKENNTKLSYGKFKLLKVLTEKKGKKKNV